MKITSNRDPLSNMFHQSTFFGFYDRESFAHAIVIIVHELMHILSADCAAELSSTFIFQAVILYNRAKVLPNVMNYSMIIYNFIMLTITVHRKWLDDVV